MRRFLIAAVGLFIAAGPSGPAGAQEAAAGGVEEVQTCIDANLPKKSAVWEIEMDSRDRSGGKQTLDAKLYWKRGKKDLAKTLIEIEGPPDSRGMAYLILEKRGRDDDLFSYLPELRKVRRLQASSMGGSLFGTDFTYEDMKHLMAVSEQSDTRRLPDSTILGEIDVFVLEANPTPGESDYERIVTYVEKAHCVPIKVEFFGAGDEKMKELTADPASVKQVGNVWLAHLLNLRSLQNESETRLEIDDAEIDGDVKDRYFSTTHLERRR